MQYSPGRMRKKNATYAMYPRQVASGVARRRLSSNRAWMSWMGMGLTRFDGGSSRWYPRSWRVSGSLSAQTRRAGGRWSPHWRTPGQRPERTPQQYVFVPGPRCVRGPLDELGGQILGGEELCRTGARSGGSPTSPQKASHLPQALLSAVTALSHDAGGDRVLYSAEISAESVAGGRGQRRHEFGCG